MPREDEPAIRSVLPDTIQMFGHSAKEDGIVPFQTLEKVQTGDRVRLKGGGVKSGESFPVPVLKERFSGCECPKGKMVSHERFVKNHDVRSKCLPGGNISAAKIEAFTINTGNDRRAEFTAVSPQEIVEGRAIVICRREKDGEANPFLAL